MPLTLGLTGMDPATEASLKAAFTDANARLGKAWELVPTAAADYVVVDMDSMYGPMSWLRLHASGKTVIGLTSAPRTQADLLLAQPFDASSLFALLSEIAPQPDATDTAGPGNIDADKPAAKKLPAVPQPVEEPPEAQPIAEEPAAIATALPVEPKAAGPRTSLREPTAESPDNSKSRSPVVGAEAVPALSDAQTAAPTNSEPSTLGEWVASGRLARQVKFERDGVALLIDTASGKYFGPNSLKPLAKHVTSQAVAGDFTSIPDWGAESAKLGPAQPLTRLVWYAGLLAHEGTLTPGFDPEARFQLLKWPQTEREYPKHFRIATTMMRGPATLNSVAEASGVSIAEVTDFINASLATGFADIERLPEPEPEPKKSGGLFGRLRGR